MMIETPHIFNNSPIEFILIGPFKGRDVVLVQSKEPGLDLFGLVNHRFERLKDIPQYGLFSNLLSGKERQLNVVDSDQALDVDHQADDRFSLYRFIWVGAATRNDKKYFQKDFEDSLRSIILALAAKDDAGLSILIGGLVLQCSAYDKKRLKSRQNLILIFVFYILGFILITIYFFFIRAYKIR